MTAAVAGNYFQKAYTDLEPLPDPSEVVPTLRKVINATAVIFSTFILSVGVALCFSLSEWQISVFTCLGVGGTIGLVAGFALWWFIEDLGISKYRVETLQRVEATQNDPKALKAFEELKKIFERPLKKFHQTYEYHTLHNRITVITDALNQNRHDVIKVWFAFLKHLEKTTVLNADGKPIVLNFSMEIDRLQRKVPKLTAEWFDLSAPTAEKDLEAMEALQKVSFGERYVSKKEVIRTKLNENKRNRCVVVRNEQTRELLGFAITVIQKEPLLEQPDLDRMYLMAIARKPGAANLQIGEKILGPLIDNLQEGEGFYLHVRKSNPAISLYKKAFFVPKKTVPNYYPADPPEDAYLMEFDWEEYRKARESQQRAS